MYFGRYSNEEDVIALGWLLENLKYWKFKIAFKALHEQLAGLLRGTIHAKKERL